MSDNNQRQESTLVAKPKPTRTSDSSVPRELYNLRAVVATLFLLLVGISMVLASVAVGIDWLRALLESVGLSLMTIGIISFLYEVFLRRSYLQTVREVVSRELVNAEHQFTVDITESIRELVRDSLPRSFANIQEAGIVDAYHHLELESVRSKIQSCRGTQIRFAKMWIPYMYGVGAELSDAILNRSCSVQVLLLRPDAREAIEKRARSLPYFSAEQIADKIAETLGVLAVVRDRLPDDKKEKLEVKLHNRFVAASLFWYGDVIVFGSYLDGRPATEGMQIKIAGSNHLFFHDLSRHFERQWNDPENIEPDWERYRKEGQKAEVGSMLAIGPD